MFSLKNLAYKGLIWHGTLQWLRQNITHSQKSQSTHHILPLQVSYGESIVRMLKKNYHNETWNINGHSEAPCRIPEEIAPIKLSHMAHLIWEQLYYCAAIT